MATNGHQNENLPIVVAGGGCVGVFLGLLLCQSDIKNEVIVVEPSPPNEADTRAMSHQPSIFPLFDQAGLMPELEKIASKCDSFCFRKGAAHGHELIAGKTFPKSERSTLLLPQWRFQELVISKVRAHPKGEVRMGSRVTGFEEHEGSVSVKIADKIGNEETVEAAYLAGADGGQSTIRKLLGESLKGETLDTLLVATDVIFDFHAYGFYDANFVIDPEHYGLFGRINDQGLWRVSYGVPAGTPEKEVFQGVDAKMKIILPEGGKAGYEVKRVAPYKAQQRCADTFWKGGARVGILGDAAHLTNPYAGAGLAAGIADAASLGSVLIHILNGGASDSTKLLSSWAAARRHVFLNIVDKPSRMSYERVRAKVATEEDLEALMERDPMVKALRSGTIMMPPSLSTDPKTLEGW
ncbi:monooxygenase [Polyplosphaeria fusca]|uniref:Monooxygenase n=1 Tax=Polyplosphaeria fusca TaxID=682080 RepID=A0A9P4QWG2_9PLEO|nr:monooxygenase [Polyplosphaeria fusca]